MERTDNILDDLIPDPTLPDVQQDANILKEERLFRAQNTMKAANANVTKQLFGQNEVADANEKAAICIQKRYRGYQGRKEYEKELYDQYVKVGIFHIIYYLGILKYL
ncbi:hypothetical protein LOTGIDRAFT_160127 [Lottia gigantea]|uniref:Uncharacterized protein n=1 Tax=Lottia gigantea TaxID=225164 RepID=V4AMY7_LOTGI|nr:hypothetical protein LOTGIDRAFT_160127 [Lottia gigantea]ESO96140.1 hypothetical protein LOTGIDRAFT_160127 [Lottia gigantea]